MSKRKIHISKTSDTLFCGKIHGEGVEAVLTMPGATCKTCIRVYEDMGVKLLQQVASSTSGPEFLPVPEVPDYSHLEARTMAFMGVDFASLPDQTAVVRVIGDEIIAVEGTSAGNLTSEEIQKILEKVMTENPRFTGKHPALGTGYGSALYRKEGEPIAAFRLMRSKSYRMGYRSMENRMMAWRRPI